MRTPLRRCGGTSTTTPDVLFSHRLEGLRTSEARTCASRRKRATRSGSWTKLSGRIFRATSRPSLVSWARYTSPIRSGVVEYNFRAMDTRSELGDPDALGVYGTDLPTATREAPGMSAFALEDGVVYHTYSAYTRGLDSLWGMYQWLDRAPLGRNEMMVRGLGDLRAGVWYLRHDEYDKR